MGRYNVSDVPIDQLWLDENNPRFIIPPNPTQQSIVNYLLDYEEVEQLAKDIIIGGGLYAGERIIVIKESDKFIVVEGNRRVCACKILLHPELLSERRPAAIDEIRLLTDTHKNVIDEICIIPVDLMKNRLSAQSSLAAKHIDGIKKWSTLSKYKFITSEFDNGKAIDEISVITGITKQKIRSGLKDYRIIQYVLELPLWTEQQKRDYLDLQELKTTRLTRLFSAKAKKTSRLRLRDVLKMSYDEDYIIKTELKKEEFDNIIFMVAQAAFVPDYCENFNGTRSTYEDILPLMNYLQQNPHIKYTEEDEADVEKNKINKDNQEGGDLNTYDDSVEASNTAKKLSENRKNAEKEQEKKTGNNQKKQYTTARNYLIPENFTVTCKNIKINDIINELKKLNCNVYINAPAVLLRVLLELSLKYYLNAVNETGKIREGDLSGTYNNVLEMLRVQKKINNVEHSNLVQLKKNSNIFNIFNGCVHYDTILPSKDNLIYYFDNLRKLLEICLNIE